jgi:hypothetical protein
LGAFNNFTPVEVGSFGKTSSKKYRACPIAHPISIDVTNRPNIRCINGRYGAATGIGNIRTMN